MPVPGSSRKQLFVNSRIQGCVLRRFCGYWLVYHFVLWHTLFIFDFLRSGVATLDGGEQQPFGEFYAAFFWKYFPLLIAAAAILPLLLHDSLKTTNRIAGPLVRFTNALRSLREKQFVREVRLRDGDLLVEFQNEFNEFLNFYNHDTENSRTILTSVGAQEEPEEELLLRQVREIRAETRLEETRSPSTQPR